MVAVVSSPATGQGGFCVPGVAGEASAKLCRSIDRWSRPGAVSGTWLDTIVQKGHGDPLAARRRPLMSFGNVRALISTR